MSKDIVDNLQSHARASSAPTTSCRLMENGADEIVRLRCVVALAAQDLSLIVAKHAIGKDRTAVRMTKYLNTEKRK